MEKVTVEDLKEIDEALGDPRAYRLSWFVQLEQLSFSFESVSGMKVGWEVAQERSGTQMGRNELICCELDRIEEEIKELRERLEL